MDGLEIERYKVREFYDSLGGEKIIELQKRIEFFYFKYAMEQHHIVARMDGRIAGVAGLQQNPYNKEVDEVWIKFLSIDSDYLGRGLSQILLTDTVNWARENGYQLKPSSYADDGEKYLSHIIEEICDRYPEAWLQLPQAQFTR